MVTLASLGMSDLDAALALSTSENWNQSAAEWGRMMRLEPEGCFAARDGDRIVGTVTTITYGRDLAWIGMMLVHPEVRRRGIGAALMGRSLDYAHERGVRSVKLDATPAGRPLYESLGFVAEAELERWQGVARADANAAQHDHAPDPRALLALDREAYDVDRARLVEALAADTPAGPFMYYMKDGTPSGYALARRGRAATYIGPLIARTKDVVAPILGHMVARFAGQEVCLDRQAGGWLDAATLEAHGLTKRRILTRMRHGEASDAATSPSIAASTGPEFG